MKHIKKHDLLNKRRIYWFEKKKQFGLSGEVVNCIFVRFCFCYFRFIWFVFVLIFCFNLFVFCLFVGVRVFVFVFLYVVVLFCFVCFFFSFKSNVRTNIPNRLLLFSYILLYAAVNRHIELTLLKGRQRFDTISTSNLEVYKFRDW